MRMTASCPVAIMGLLLHGRSMKTSERANEVEREASGPRHQNKIENLLKKESFMEGLDRERKRNRMRECMRVGEKCLRLSE